MTVEPPKIPAGWYPDVATGGTRWWDGNAWGPLAMRPPARKESWVAYLLLLLLGGFGAHHFYLNNPGVAITQILLWWIGWVLTFVVVGYALLLAVVIWWIVDLCTIPSMVRAANGESP